jgi:hypothetical protein
MRNSVASSVFRLAGGPAGASRACAVSNAANARSSGTFTASATPPSGGRVMATPPLRVNASGPPLVRLG